MFNKLLQKEIQNYLQTEQVSLELPKNFSFGDLATPAPLNFAKAFKMPPLKLAENIKTHLDDKLSDFCQTEIAAPGFLNFRFKPLAFAQILQALNIQNLISQTTEPKSLLIEYVSANPTGDLHLGHGRGAVVGSTLANILKATGREVKTEFYINDAGEQIQKLGRSAWNLYKNLNTNNTEDYPPELIKPYLNDLDENLSFEELTPIIKDRILKAQKQVLEKLKVEFDAWVSEKTDLHETGLLEQALEELKQKNLTYQKDNALWLKSSELGDERDRVLIKSDNNRPTYLAGDLAYHLSKFNRADELLDIFGADHKGQEISLKVALKALGKNIDNFSILFIQFVSLVEQGQEVKMSKRTGSVITVEEVLEKVGSDAFRFMLLMSHINNRLAFDIDLAKRTDEQNPVFYVQYAHARACSILRNALNPAPDETTALFNSEELQIALNSIPAFLPALDASLPEKEIASTKELILKLLFFDQEVQTASNKLNPSGLAHYLIDLATCFHSFYNTPCKVILPEQKPLSLARLCLVHAFKRILQTGLGLLAVSAPERM